jgi:acyl-CoA synthetase (AMP-forming)/AMP-acid ligase II/thioesterase domain-containing protein
MSPETVYELLRSRAGDSPGSTAIAAPGRAPLTYGRLLRHIDDFIVVLNRAGIGRNDRVAIVLPNGPEMAVAFLSVASCATSAPLNPAYRSGEFEFYLSDLRARVLITSAGGSPACDTARKLGITVMELTADTDAPAGLFRLSGGDSRGAAAGGGVATAEDTALILHTSGTTSRPKIVPLTQRNICSSARHIQLTLQLTPQDRCLNVMPLFHIHGLIGATMSSTASGASIVCTPGFDESRFFEWLRSERPTWYTAVPTMHQAVLGRAAEHRATIEATPLRFIRSSSSSLPPQVMAELETTFHCPVIESYGMTEASHQMASNPLPPRKRKPGSVGVAAGPELAIMDAEGTLLGPDVPGEIVIRGANVTGGYENNPAANESAFTHGWFRTGDQGRIDEDGYVFITGRLKEIINRGGEKVMPREVDEALLDHPAVGQAVTFAVPHPRLGEDIAAAVVLRGQPEVTEQELREFVRARLAEHKVPTRVVILESIPKGPTGKLQRIGLAEKLADKLTAPFIAPRNLVEEKLARIWAEMLHLPHVGIQDNFFAIGGDSLLAAGVLAEVDRVFGTDLPLSQAFQAPTIEQMAIVVDRYARDASSSSLVTIHAGSDGQPIYYLPGTAGNVFGGLGAFAAVYAPGRRVYGLEERLSDPTGIEEQAAHYLDEISRLQPRGPYRLIGSCSGGAVSFAIARRLIERGEQVALLAMVEPTPPYLERVRALVSFAGYILDRLLNRASAQIGEMHAGDSRERGTYVRRKFKNVARQWALRRYLPSPIGVELHLFLTAESLRATHTSRVNWREFALGGATIHEVPGTHISVVGSSAGPATKAHLEVIAGKLKELISPAS